MMTRVQAERMMGVSDPSTLVTEAHRVHADMGGLAMLIISELSDVQEELAMGRYEAARQRLNRIKYVVGETRDPAHPLEWQWGRDESCVIVRKTTPREHEPERCQHGQIKGKCSMAFCGVRY